MHKQQRFVCDVNPGGLSQCTVPLLQNHRQLLDVTLAVVDFVRRPMLLLSRLYGLFFFNIHVQLIARVYRLSIHCPEHHSDQISPMALRWSQLPVRPNVSLRACPSVLPFRCR